MDAESLRGLYDHDGPFISVYVDTTSATEDAATQLDLRRRNLRRELAAAGADAASIDAVDAQLADHTGGSTRVVIAAAGRVLLATSLPEPPARELAGIAPLPRLTPLLDALALRVPHVVVLADKEGGDVLAYTSAADPVQSGRADSGVWPVHHTGSGGWSSKRYDNTVRNSWEESAREVADLVERVAKDIDAQLVIGCGDPRALSLLREHLPAALGEHFTVVDGGGRHVDGSDEAVARRVVAAVAEFTAQRTLALLSRFADERGRSERAADGAAATVAALRMAQVGTLLLTSALEPRRVGYFGAAPTDIALARDELTALGVADVRSDELAEVLVRAALGTGAEVRFVAGDTDESPAGGVGALLRFPAEPGTRA